MIWITDDEGGALAVTIVGIIIIIIMIMIVATTAAIIILIRISPTNIRAGPNGSTTCLTIRLFFVCR